MPSVKKNPAQSARAKNQWRDPASGRFAMAAAAAPGVEGSRRLTRASAAAGGVQGSRRFTRASAAAARVEGVPPLRCSGNAAAGVGDPVPDVPPGFENVTPMGAAGDDGVPHLRSTRTPAAGVDDTVPNVPPGFENVTPMVAAASTSTSADRNKDCACCNHTDNELNKLKEDLMKKIVHLEERDYKNSIKIYILEQKGKGDDKAIAKLKKELKELKENQKKD